MADCRGLIIDTELHQRFEKMTIDEQKEEFDLSDHNMLTSTFTVKTKTKINSIRTHSKMTYVKIYEETSSIFTAQVKIKINHNTTLALEQYKYIIKEAKQQYMVRTINKKNQILQVKKKNMVL